nr:pinin [Leptinotarsa decemlineata]
MGTKTMKSFGSLQHELEEAKNSLKGVDENLKRLIGRDPSELPPRISLKRPAPDDKGRAGVKGPNRMRNFTHENEEPVPKRRNNISVFKRLSEKVVDDELVVPHRGLISKVIVTPKEIPSREEALEAQSKDEKFKARNRRMFGALLGTLQKFQQEETKLKPREQKRAQLEKKIEEHEIKEKEEVKKERQELFLSRKKKQAEIKIIELKMLRMKEYSAWEETQKPRTNFILTKTKPHIHYLPRRMTNETKKLLEESKAEVEKILEKKQQEITEEMQHIEDRMKRNFDYKFRQREGKDEHPPAEEESRHREDKDQEDDNDGEENVDNEDHTNTVTTETQMDDVKTETEEEKVAPVQEQDLVTETVENQSEPNNRVEDICVPDEPMDVSTNGHLEDVPLPPESPPNHQIHYSNSEENNVQKDHSENQTGE